MLLAAVTSLPAQSPPEATLSFRFERPGLPVPDFRFTVHRDGTGIYTASIPPPPPSRYSTASLSPAEAPAPVERPIALSPKTTSEIFQKVIAAGRFRKGCESKAKNIANTGIKTLAYTGPEGEGGCTYNYTEDKSVASLTATFQALAFTLDEGRKLEQAHRYDRLGLDQEMRQLVEAVSGGNAIELANIAPVLTSIASDPQLLERVRSRANSLLTQASPPQN